jgi:hypothetical protein
MAFCTLTTQYLHDKLTPTVVFQRDIWHDAEKMADVKGSAKADMWIFRLKYAPNHIWSFKGQILILTGDGNRYYRGMHYKDNISFTAQYQF